jgi:N,N-dimethylformamidase
VDPAKTLVGYCEPFSAAPGNTVRLMVSSHLPGTCDLKITRLRCGDPHVGLDEVEVSASCSTGAFSGREQALHPGSHAIVESQPALASPKTLRVTVRVRASLPGDGRCQALIGTWDANSGRGWTVFLDEAGVPCLRVGHTDVSAGRSVPTNRWVELEAGCAGGRLWIAMRPLPTRSPAINLVAGPAEADTSVDEPLSLASERDLLFAAWWAEDGRPGAHFDGRLEDPFIEGVAGWDFAKGIGTDTIHDTGPLGLHGRTRQCPARAITGSRWAGSIQSWTADPRQYAAIHFHHDDLVDAQWEADATFQVPEDLESGIYCFRVTGPDGGIDRTPFVVKPAPSSSSAEVLFLLPTATYLAYGNHRMTISGADFFPARNRLRPEFQYLRDHPDVGLSMYEYHPDSSGVMYSSMRRPVLNLKPGADGWAFTADTNLLAFLEQSGHRYHVATDEDLHQEGAALLRRYRVVMTGSHPEYWSTAMLDALEDHLALGGRLMYLGGNGFYWRVAFNPEHPGVMEVRRAEDGTRGWIAEPGEYHHAWGGEYGGLWRRLGRAPNLLVGVGFAAQGFDRAAAYRRRVESFHSRASWIFDGVESADVIGDYGVGRGAAGQEIDRYDESLGSPPHAVVLATADEHSEQMLRTKEELLATRAVIKDPKIRADMIFFETPAGGAVFSVGSIAWFGALSHNGWNNDICRITRNVLDRFVDPTRFAPPS